MSGSIWKYLVVALSLQEILPFKSLDVLPVVQERFAGLPGTFPLGNHPFWLLQPSLCSNLEATAHFGFSQSKYMLEIEV